VPQRLSVLLREVQHALKRLSRVFESAGSGFDPQAAHPVTCIDTRFTSDTSGFASRRAGSRRFELT